MAVTVQVLEQVTPVVDSIVAQLAGCGFSDKEIFGVRLAVREALVNAIRHGNGGDPTKKVQVRCDCRDEMVVVEIEDEGKGFNPQGVPDPCAPENLQRASGRGLLLMRHYATWLRFNDTGNRVTLCKRKGTRGRPAA